MPINIAIDGTAGSGKGTVAKRISQALGIYHLDTGAMFRAIAYKCRKEKINPHNEKEVCKIVDNIDYEIVFEKDSKGNQIQKNMLDGEDLKDKIRTEQVSADSSTVSKFACVREYTKEIQVDIAKRYDIIMEGRDIGTVIIPNAEFKFFLTATPEERARRRLKQLSLPESEFKKVLIYMKERDKNDTERELSPLKAAEDAHYIDNTNMTIDETVARILNIIKRKYKLVAR